MNGYQGYNEDYSMPASMVILSGAWSGFGNYYGNLDTNICVNNCIWPYIYSETRSSTYGYGNALIETADPQIDGGFQLLPIVPCQETPSENIIGELDGIFAVVGDGPIAEDVITINSKPYKVFQNTYHTNAYDYFAMLLE
jgi:hypothetical protein